jgi:hypothetical protein
VRLLVSPTILLLTKNAANKCINFEKKEKWLKVTVANFLKNINWICLKFVVFIHHTLIHLWSKFHSQWVHGLGDINKSIYALFMEKCLLTRNFLCEKESPQSEIFLSDFCFVGLF